MKTDITGCINFAVNLPLPLYLRMREFCFKHNKTKKSLIVEALEKELSRETGEEKNASRRPNVSP